MQRKMFCKSTQHSAQQQQQPQQMQQQHFKNKFYLIAIGIVVCLLATDITKTNAVPTDSTGGIVQHLPLLQRALRDVTEPKDAASGESILEQPQVGQCLLDGVLVDEKTVYCEKQVGCRAIQKTGHCCPDYKCDCHKDGKTYSNGDKLVDPETPCTVCYCQGGEILCSSVTCFQRDDCTPKYIPGRCCPEYNDCPIVFTDNNKTVTTTTTTTTVKPDMPQASFNPKITIKEITKPIEIRITDDNKAMPMHYKFKSSSTEAPSTTIATTTTAATTAKTTPASISTTSASATTASSIFTISTNSPLAHTANNNNPLFKLSEDNNPTHAILPMRVINNESLKLSASVAYPSTERLPLLPSLSVIVPETIVNEYNDNSNSERPLTNFATNGLQRVEYTDSSDPSKVNIKREYFFSTEGVAVLSASNAEDYDNTDILLNANSDSLLQQASAELDTDTAGSDNVLRIYVTTDGPNINGSSSTNIAINMDQSRQSTTEGIETNIDERLNADNDDNENFFVAQLHNQMTTDAPEKLRPTNEPLAVKVATHNDAKPLDMTTEAPATPTTTADLMMKSSTETIPRADEDDIAIPVESNPAYPSLPEDDFSIRDVNFPLTETDDIGEVDLKDEQRSIGSNAFKSTKLLDEANYANMDGSGSDSDVGSGSGLIEENFMSSTATLHQGIGHHSTTENSKFARNKAELIYSAEDTSAETAILNSTDFQVALKITNNETESNESLEADTLESLLMLGSGSGSGEIIGQVADEKRREPTTPRPRRKSAMEVDIDELGQNDEGSAATPDEDPKLDVESLKIDKNENNDNVGKIGEGTAKANILAQDKTIEESADTANHDDLGSIQRLLLRRVY